MLDFIPNSQMHNHKKMYKNNAKQWYLDTEYERGEKFASVQVTLF